MTKLLRIERTSPTSRCTMLFVRRSRAWIEDNSVEVIEEAAWLATNVTLNWDDLHNGRCCLMSTDRIYVLPDSRSLGMDGPISLTGTVHLFMTTWRRWKGWKIQRPIISENKLSEEFGEAWQSSIKYFRMQRFLCTLFAFVWGGIAWQTSVIRHQYLRLSGPQQLLEVPGPLRPKSNQQQNVMWSRFSLFW